MGNKEDTEQFVKIITAHLRTDSLKKCIVSSNIGYVGDKKLLRDIMNAMDAYVISIMTEYFDYDGENDYKKREEEADYQLTRDLFEINKLIKKHPVAYEWHNLETGHCYVDYIPHPDQDEKNGYVKTPLYK